MTKTVSRSNLMLARERSPWRNGFSVEFAERRATASSGRISRARRIHTEMFSHRRQNPRITPPVNSRRAPVGFGTPCERSISHFPLDSRRGSPSGPWRINAQEHESRSVPRTRFFRAHHTRARFHQTRTSRQNPEELIECFDLGLGCRRFSAAVFGENEISRGVCEIAERRSLAPTRSRWHLIMRTGGYRISPSGEHSRLYPVEITSDRILRGPCSRN